MKHLSGILLLGIVVAACGGAEKPQVQSIMSRKVDRDPNAPINANEWLAANTMLQRAGQLMRERGFQQGSLVPVARECMATALEHAFQEKDYSIVDFNYAREALAQVLKVPRDPAPLPGDVLDVPYWGRELMDWNDTKGRTEADALNAFSAAAELASNRRQQAIAKAVRRSSL